MSKLAVGTAIGIAILPVATSGAIRLVEYVHGLRGAVQLYFDDGHREEDWENAVDIVKSRYTMYIWMVPLKTVGDIFIIGKSVMEIAKFIFDQSTVMNGFLGLPTSLDEAVQKIFEILLRFQGRLKEFAQGLGLWGDANADPVPSNASECNVNDISAIGKQLIGIFKEVYHQYFTILSVEIAIYMVEAQGVFLGVLNAFEKYWKEKCRDAFPN